MVTQLLEIRGLVQFILSARDIAGLLKQETASWVVSLNKRLRHELNYYCPQWREILQSPLTTGSSSLYNFPQQQERISSPNDFAVLCSEKRLLQKETAGLCSETVNANQQRMKKLQIAWEFISLLSHSQIDKNEYQNTKTRKLLKDFLVC